MRQGFGAGLLPLLQLGTGEYGGERCECFSFLFSVVGVCGVHVQNSWEWKKLRMLVDYAFHI